MHGPQFLSPYNIYVTMLDLLLTSTPAAELVFRMAATTLVVIIVAMAVGRFGPLVGGALAGLPIVLGPGFYFLLDRAPLEFNISAAAYSILSLCATQVFTLVYIAAASRLSALISILMATLSWFISIFVLRLLPPDPVAGAVLFVLITSMSRYGAKRFHRNATKVRRGESFALLLARAGLAGILVAVVTATASQLGSQWSGILLAYPVGYTVIAVTIQRQYGRNVVIATLTSTLLGTGSLAAFCFSLALTLRVLPGHGAFAAALLTSLTVTTALVYLNHRRSQKLVYGKTSTSGPP